MYVYRNRKTSATFVTSCVCTGKDYEEVKASAPKGKNRKKMETATYSKDAVFYPEEHQGNDTPAEADGYATESGVYQ